MISDFLFDSERWDRRHVFIESITRRNMKQNEPAKENYFFVRWLHDFLSVTEETLARNKNFANWIGNKLLPPVVYYGADGEWLKKSVRFFGWIAVVSVWIALWMLGGLWLSVLLAIAGIVSILFIAILKFFQVVLWGIDYINRHFRGLFSACPHCHERALMPVFLCNRCNVKHFRLIPTLRYGVFRRKCDCGNGLGTTPLFGRGKLTAICPCGIELGTNIGQTKLLAFPIVGGPSAGKTAFLMATIYTLVNKIAPQYGWQLKYPYDKDRETADNAKYLVENGIPPLKTTLAQILPTAFNLEIDDGSRIPKRLY